MRVELFDHAYCLQPLRYRTEFYLYCLRQQFFSRNDAVLATRLVRSGETVIDLGANIGNFAVPMAYAVGQTGRVIAVEPCLQVFRRLVQHIGMNPGGRIVPLRLAIGERNGDEVFLATGPDIGEGTLEPSPPLSERFRIGDLELITGEWVPQMTLDALLDQLAPHHPAPTLVKIDTEGHELSVLQGAPRMLADTEAPLLYIEIHPQGLAQRGQSVRDLFNLLLEADFLVHQFGHLVQRTQIAWRSPLIPVTIPDTPPVNADNFYVLAHKPTRAAVVDRVFTS